MKRSTVGIIIVAVIICGMGYTALKVVSGMAKGRAQAAKELKQSTAQVTEGDIVVRVVETGSLEPQTHVEVKSRVGGRIAKLLVDEGDYVEKGDLIAIIDPQETELQVAQSRAQLKGARSSVRRTEIEIQQRKVTAQTNLNRAQSRLRQLDKELEAQPKLTNAAITSAQASLATAKKNYETLTKVTQPNARTSAVNALQDAKHNLDQATLDERRQKDLYDHGYVAKKVWEQAKLELEFAKTRHKSASDSLQRLDDDHRLERDRARSAIRQAEAELARAKTNSIQDALKKEEYRQAVANVRDAEAALKDVAALEQSKINSMASVEQLESVLRNSERELNETEIKAPMSGIVSKRYVQAGELVSSLSSFSSGTPIVKIEDRRTMQVRLNVNEIDVAKLKEGMKASITVDAMPEKKFEGIVSKIAPSMIAAADGTVSLDAVVKYEVEVRLTNASDKLKTGMSATCEMKAIEHLNVLTAPTEFVGEDEEGSYVMLKSKKSDKKGKKTRVVVGESTGSKVEIISGVEKGAYLAKPEFTGPKRQGFMGGPSEDDEGSEEGGGTGEGG